MHRSEPSPEEIVARVAAQAEDGDEELTARLVARMREATPELFADADVAREMERVTGASARRVRRILGEPERAVLAPPADTLDFATLSARYGLPLISLIEACRMAQVVTSDWWRRRLESCVADRGAIAAAVDLTNERIGEFIDLVVAASREAYATDWEDGLDGRRMRLVQRLLAEEPLDVEDAARLLNHPLRATHTAMVLWAEDGRQDVPPLDAAARELAAAAGATRTLRVPCTDRSLWLWAVTERDLPRRLECTSGVLAAVGTAQPGVAGFRRSHREACEAQRVARMQGARRATVTRFRDVEVAALMSRDEDALRRFLTRTLGPLADAGESAERLRRTLSAYLAAGQQVGPTARRLGVHRNTVSYRLRALEDALGPLADGRGVDLALALELCERLGPVAGDAQPARAG